MAEGGWWDERDHVVGGPSFLARYHTHPEDCVKRRNQRPCTKRLSGALRCVATSVAAGGARLLAKHGLRQGPYRGRLTVWGTQALRCPPVTAQRAFATYDARGCRRHYGASGTLELIFELPSAAVLDSPDNSCVSPRGGWCCVKTAMLTNMSAA